MATALARRLQERDGRRVRIVGGNGVPRWSEVWNHNPRIAAMHERGDFAVLAAGPNARHYIAEKRRDRWVWNDVFPEPGEIYLTEAERAQAIPAAVVIEPNLKPAANPNKRWRHWQAVVDALPGLNWIQMGQGPVLRGAWHVRTPTFRDACGVMSQARLYVGHEGGLHHAAAALGVRGVVVFGGYISPAQTGYRMHRNLFTGGVPCGSRLPCEHCRQSMDAISVEWVLDEIHNMLREST